MPKPLTRVQLDKGRCMVEHEHGETCGGGGPLYMHSACHTGAGVEAFYEGGVMHFTCRDCGAVVVDVLVAKGSPPPPPPRVQRRRR